MYAYATSLARIDEEKASAIVARMAQKPSCQMLFCC
jgi:hypothetical protein